MDSHLSRLNKQLNSEGANKMNCLLIQNVFPPSQGENILVLNERKLGYRKVLYCYSWCYIYAFDKKQKSIPRYFILALKTFF